MTRGGVAIFRCHADDSRRALEIPQWMFDAARCCRMPLAPRAVVACLRALRCAASDPGHRPDSVDLRARRRAPGLDSEGGAQATPDSHDSGAATTAVRADRAVTLDRHPDRSPRAHDRAARATTAPAHVRASRQGGARTCDKSGPSRIRSSSRW